MMKEYKKLIFVDTDNTCRSIMAEAVMKAICKNKPITVCSRGLVVLFPEPINPKATAILKGDGLVPAKTCTEELLPGDLTEGTLVLTMTAKEKKKASEKLANLDRDREKELEAARKKAQDMVDEARAAHVVRFDSMPTARAISFRAKLERL